MFRELSGPLSAEAPKGGRGCRRRQNGRACSALLRLARRCTLVMEAPAVAQGISSHSLPFHPSHLSSSSCPRQPPRARFLSRRRRIAGGGEEMGTPATSRELCSDRILDDAGGAFRMVAVGGSIFHFLKGTENPPTPPYYAAEELSPVARKLGWTHHLSRCPCPSTHAGRQQSNRRLGM
jgi:hypothetical protein